MGKPSLALRAGIRFAPLSASRSRTPGDPGAPPQIPASGVAAPGSYLGSKRTTAAAPIRSSDLCRSCRIWDREPLALSQPPALPSTLPTVWAPRSQGIRIKNLNRIFDCASKVVESRPTDCCRSKSASSLRQCDSQN